MPPTPASRPIDDTAPPTSSATLPIDLLDERAREVVDEVRTRLAPVDTWIRTMARDRPLTTLAAAVGVGYLLGRLIRRV